MEWTRSYLAVCLFLQLLASFAVRANAAVLVAPPVADGCPFASLDPNHDVDIVQNHGPQTIKTVRLLVGEEEIPIQLVDIHRVTAHFPHFGESHLLELFNADHTLKANLRTLNEMARLRGVGYIVRISFVPREGGLPRLRTSIREVPRTNGAPVLSLEFRTRALSEAPSATLAGVVTDLLFREMRQFENNQYSTKKMWDNWFGVWDPVQRQFVYPDASAAVADAPQPILQQLYMNGFGHWEPADLSRAVEQILRTRTVWNHKLTFLDAEIAAPIRQDYVLALQMPPHINSSDARWELATERNLKILAEVKKFKGWQSGVEGAIGVNNGMSQLADAVWNIPLPPLWDWAYTQGGSTVMGDVAVRRRLGATAP